MNQQTLGSRFRVFGLLHVLAAAVGGMAGILVLRGIVATLFGAHGFESAPYLAVALISLSILVDGGVLSGIPVPSTGVQVPREWRSVTPPLFWVPAFGLLLGFTLLTRISTACVLAGLIVLSVKAESLTLLLVIGATYGVSRTVPTLIGFNEETLLSPPKRVVRTALGGLAIVSIAVM